MNNPNKSRKQKRFFASDFIKIEEEDMPDNITYEPSDSTDEDSKYKQKDGFDINKALKLNNIEDKETDGKKPKPPKKVRIKKSLCQSVELRERLSRVKTSNQILKGFVKINNAGEVTKVLGIGFVLIGGKYIFFDILICMDKIPMKGEGRVGREGRVCPLNKYFKRKKYVFIFLFFYFENYF